MPPKPLIERARRGPSDEIWTPPHALGPLLPYLDKRRTIWECAPGSGELAKALIDKGYSVLYNDVPDFMTDRSRGTVIVTNPPFSKKAQFLRRANELKMPFAFLLPVTALGSRKCQRELGGAQIIFLPRRVDFTGKGRPWFAVAWFTMRFGINLGGDYEDADYTQLIFPEEE